MALPTKFVARWWLLLVVVAALMPAAPPNRARAAPPEPVPAVPAPQGPGPPAPLGGVNDVPNLQVSPELLEVRSGAPVTLTARLYHGMSGPLSVAFELAEVGARPRGERHRPAPEVARCVADPSSRSCTVTFVRTRAALGIVSAWIELGDGTGRDLDEGRLASFSRPPLADADCTLDDGEPIDRNCRNDNESDVTPGAAEPDGTDVVRIAWTGITAANLDCDDPGGPEGTEIEVRASSDRTVTYLCRATTRATGEPLTGAPLAAEIMGGPFDPDKGADYPADYGSGLAADGGSRRLCTTTSPLGHCRLELRVPGSGGGKAPVCFWIDDNNDGGYGAAEGDGGGCTDERVDEPEANDATDAVIIEFRS